MYALDAVTGATKWTTTLGGFLATSPAVANGVVYVGSSSHAVYGLDTATGAIKWTSTTAGTLASPAVSDGVIFAGSADGALTAYAPWTFTRPSCAPDTQPGLSPCQLQDAYRLPSSVAGAGRTVAIVAAFDNPNAEADLAVYRDQYGLPPCTTANGCFKKLNQDGVEGSYPPGNAAWGMEISLDLDAVSAICPLCHIVLVEANDDTVGNTVIAEDTAAAENPVAISNSWGLPEFAGQQIFESHFSHPGIMATFATGDDGYGTFWPAVSPGVVAVGGTVLAADSSTRGWTETVWSGAGSGCSSMDAKPSWQDDAGCARRTIADVAALAGSPGATVYDSYGVTPGF